MPSQAGCFTKIRSVVALSSRLGVAGLLVGCQLAESGAPSPSAAQEFTAAVTQTIVNTSEYGASEAEIYLTYLAALGRDGVLSYGDRFCESLRRGTSIAEVVTTLQMEQQQQQYSSDEYQTRLFILTTAQQSRCPDSHFPPVGWQRSLFFAWETVNGGTPF